jgi:Putative prokaryotic signal transducing protein
MRSADLIVVRTFADRFEAELAHSVLEAAGIDSVVRSDDAGGLRPALAFSNGAELLVRGADAERADEVLRTPAEPQDDAL